MIRATSITCVFFPFPPSRAHVGSVKRSTWKKVRASLVIARTERQVVQCLSWGGGVVVVNSLTAMGKS